MRDLSGWATFSLAALLSGCSSPLPATKEIPESRANIQVADVPKDFLEPIDLGSDSGAKTALAKRDSFKVDGTTLTIAPVGANRSVTLGFNTLTLLNGAQIITNGNDLTIAALNLEFNNSGGIHSFLGDSKKAHQDMLGANGGKIEIYAFSKVIGSLKVSLPGQDGGDGLPGAPGAPGGGGTRGANGVDGLFDCQHGGTDGGQGGKGGTGGAGGPGRAGGASGNLISMVGLAAHPTTVYSYSADWLAMAVPADLAVRAVLAVLAAKVAAVQFIVVAVTVDLKEPMEPRDDPETLARTARRMEKKF